MSHYDALAALAVDLPVVIILPIYRLIEWVVAFNLDYFVDCLSLLYFILECDLVFHLL